MKLLENDIGGSLHDLAFCDDILVLKLKAWSMKEKIDKLGFIRIKTFFFSLKDIKGTERQARDWQKIVYKNYLINDWYLKQTNLITQK